MFKDKGQVLICEILPGKSFSKMIEGKQYVKILILKELGFLYDRTSLETIKSWKRGRGLAIITSFHGWCNIHGNLSISRFDSLDSINWRFSSSNVSFVKKTIIQNYQSSMISLLFLWDNCPSMIHVRIHIFAIFSDKITSLSKSF